MSAIGPGDFVECAPPSDYRGSLNPDTLRVSGGYPKRGSLHQVREVGQFNTTGGWTDGLRFVGLVVAYPGHPDCWFEARCFRPIYRRDESLLTKLMQPMDEEVSA